jgi:hypothetical protein
MLGTVAPYWIYMGREVCHDGQKGTNDIDALVT